MKILYVATVAETMEFFTRHIQMLEALGHRVELAANFSGPLPEAVAKLQCPMHMVPFSRRPLSVDNWRAFWRIKQLVRQGRCDVVHTHTPNASALTRLACRSLRKRGLRVLYTAHGFHFFKGAPLKNWLLFYPVEKLCARWTDVLLTINREDEELARRRLPARKIVRLPGVGVDLRQFPAPKENRGALRAALGLDDRDFVLLSVGELNQNKNHGAVIRVLAQGHDHRVHYLIAGQGRRRAELEALARTLGVAGQVHLLGYRTDVAELHRAADVFVQPSFREGLPVAVLEAMASGLPLAASRVRGNTDLVTPEGGVLFDPNDPGQLAEALAVLRQASPARRAQMGRSNREKAGEFSTERVLECLKQIYQELT